MSAIILAVLLSCLLLVILSWLSWPLVEQARLQRRRRRIEVEMLLSQARIDSLTRQTMFALRQEALRRSTWS